MRVVRLLTQEFSYWLSGRNSLLFSFFLREVCGKEKMSTFQVLAGFIGIFVLYFLLRYSPKISIEKDDFDKTSWIFIAPHGGCQFRALLHGDKLLLIQLSMMTLTNDWFFFHSAHGEDQVQLEFTKIDSEAKVYGSNVKTSESFAVTIPLDYLEKMSTKDWKIKAYGKRGEKIFTVPQIMSKTFLDYMKNNIIAKA